MLGGVNMIYFFDRHSVRGIKDFILIMVILSFILSIFFTFYRQLELALTFMAIGIGLGGVALMLYGIHEFLHEQILRTPLSKLHKLDGDEKNNEDILE